MARSSGIRVRHSRGCATRTGGECRPHADRCPSRNGRDCTCRDPEGRCWPAYEASVWDWRLRRKVRRTFRSLDEARSWRTDTAKAVKDGQLGRPARRTVRDAGEALLAGMEAGVALTRSRSRFKPSVIRAYRRNLKKYVYPALGATRLADLRRRDVQRFIDGLSADGLTGSSVRNILAPLQVICRRAVEDDELVVNPTAHLRLPEGPRLRERVVPVDVALALIGALPDSLQALYATAFFAGLRRGELRALRWADVDHAVSVIAVRRTWDDVEGEVAPKSRKGIRTVPVAGLLREYLLAHKGETGRRGNDLVFGRTATKPFRPVAVAEQADAAWKGRFACGCTRDDHDSRSSHREQESYLCPTHGAKLLQRVVLHECRHTYVSLMVDAGFSLERIGDYVGHSSAYMVDRYRHLLEGHEAEAAAKFDAYLEQRTGVVKDAHSSAATDAGVPVNPK